MAQGALVVGRVAAGDRFVTAFERTLPVAVAFWLREGETDRWTLCVAPRSSDPKGFRSSYADVLRIADEIRDPYLDPFQVKLIELTDPFARAALTLYRDRPPRIPIHICGGSFGGAELGEVYLFRGPTGEVEMPSGREVLHQIIDREAAFFQQHGQPPRKIKLPILMAYDLAKCGREDLGELSGRVFKDGINVFEREGFHGMAVEIVRDRSAALEFE